MKTLINQVAESCYLVVQPYCNAFNHCGFLARRGMGLVLPNRIYTA